MEAGAQRLGVLSWWLMDPRQGLVRFGRVGVAESWSFFEALFKLSSPSSNAAAKVTFSPSAVRISDFIPPNPIPL